MRLRLFYGIFLARGTEELSHKYEFKFYITVVRLISYHFSHILDQGSRLIYSDYNRRPWIPVLYIDSTAFLGHFLFLKLKRLSISAFFKSYARWLIFSHAKGKTKNCSANINIAAWLWYCSAKRLQRTIRNWPFEIDLPEFECWNCSRFSSFFTIFECFELYWESGLQRVIQIAF